MLDLFPPLLEAAELCGADGPRSGQLPAEARRAEQGRAAGERAEQGRTVAWPRARLRRRSGGPRGARRTGAAERTAGKRALVEAELQRRAVRRSAASSHRAAEPPVRSPRRRSACATAPRRATRRATAEKNGGGGAAKSTCQKSARAEPPRRCASCPAPCPRTNPTTREFQFPISSDRSNSPSTAVVIKNWLGTIWFYR